MFHDSSNTLQIWKYLFCLLLLFCVCSWKVWNNMKILTWSILFDFESLLIFLKTSIIGAARVIAIISWLFFFRRNLWKKIMMLYTCHLNLLYVNPRTSLFGSCLNLTLITTRIPNKKLGNLVSSVWETNSR